MCPNNGLAASACYVYRGWTNTGRESALQVDWENHCSKITNTAMSTIIVQLAICVLDIKNEVSICVISVKCHGPTFLLSSLVKSEPIYLCHEERRFNAENTPVA